MNPTWGHITMTHVSNTLIDKFDKTIVRFNGRENIHMDGHGYKSMLQYQSIMFVNTFFFLLQKMLRNCEVCFRSKLV